MIHEIRPVEKTADVIDRCAHLMVSASPWDQLYFSYDQCTVSLRDDALTLHAALDTAGTIVGFLASMTGGIGGEPLLEYLCVDAAARDRGLGTAHVTYFENDLHAEADNLYLFVSDINPHAQRLYRRLGYGQVGALADFNIVGQTEFLFRKTRRPRQATHQQAATTAP